MNHAKDSFVFPRILIITDVEFDEKGFRSRDSGNKWILWNEIEQVAVLYEIHPIAIVDWDCIAFRLTQTHLSVWVAIDKSKPFMEEIARRFAPHNTPAMKDWKDERMCIRTYTIWPLKRVGEPLYINRRMRWWSWKKSLALPRRG